MNKTSIEWCDYSSNVIRYRHKETGKIGHFCVKISPGCANCYSDTLDDRFGLGLDYVRRNADLVEPVLVEKELDAILKHRKPCRIFIEDMSDLFLDLVPDAMIAEFFAVAFLCPHITFQILTKRPERMAALFSDESFTSMVSLFFGKWTSGLAGARRLEALGRWFNRPENWWPLPNIWAGTSVENQATANERLDVLCQIPARVRFVSYEPALEAVDFTRWIHPFNKEPHCKHCEDCVDIAKRYAECTIDNHPLIHWLICGGESGRNARPMHPDCARWARDQCQAAGVPFFFKQWGELMSCWNDDMPDDVYQRIDAAVNLAGYGGNEWFRVGKKAAGRLLDGRTWDEMPEVAHA